MRRSLLVRHLVAVASSSVVAILAACGSDDASSSAGIPFHGEAQALPGFAYDTGLIPASGPAQVSLKLSAGGPLLVDAEGTVSGGKLVGKPQSGHAKLDVHVKLEGRLKVDTPLKKADGPIPGLSNVDVPIVAEAPFDPFLLDGTVAEVTADVPETKLPDIPLGSVPGSLQLTIVAGSKLTAKYTGSCMSVAGGQAAHTGSARIGGTLVMKGAIALELPAPLNKTIELAQFSIPIPETVRAVPFTPVAVSSVDDGTSGPSCGATPAVDGGGVTEDGAVVPTDGAACNASTCSGCCRDGRCLSGQISTACGKPGEACESCSGATDCLDRECKSNACGPDNCGGCCEGGVCLFGDATSACGRAGAKCTSCGAGATCDSGACVSATCKSTCTSGCCAGSTCNPGNTAAACGKSGDACTACGAGQSCTGGTCAVDPSRPFDLVMVSAAVPSTNKSGGAWDVLGGLPDPFAKVVAGARTGQSPSVSDSLRPTWSYVALSNVPARDLKGAVTLEVWDEDVASNDLVGGCALRFADPDFSGALRSGTCAASATGVAFTFNYKLIPK